MYFFSSTHVLRSKVFVSNPQQIAAIVGDYY